MISDTLKTGEGPLHDFDVADATPSTRRFLEEAITQVNIHSRPTIDMHPAKYKERVGLESMIRALEKNSYEFMKVLHNSKRNKVFLVEESKSGERKAAKWFNQAEHYFKEKEAQEILLGYDRHNNILLADRFIDEDRLIISPHAARGNLGELQKKGRLTLPQVEVVAAHVLDALQYLHDHNLIHRDVKLSNIVLDIGVFGLETFQLIDYEFTQYVEFPISKNETEGMVIGTPHYMAPEIYRGKNADLRSDLYAAGVTFYHCLTGHFPFDGATDLELFRNHINKPVPDIRQHNPEMSLAFEEVFYRALAKNPADRYQSAVEFKRTLLEAARRK
ncbi:MAG: serine/threonine-protein kinase [Nanoarchaeota archaeon]|nr:serine/threonine-protein kinase [Nanoarchaeota archaeon]